MSTFERLRQYNFVIDKIITDVFAIKGCVAYQ
jgi:hypothetical protein